MGRVARLDSAVIDRIAAGEVVERPASIVKELVENAIDAGATRITVELLSGGAERVRVVDDGSGMDREDAVLCLERHATSKIRSDADLLSVATLGFRGEALPSIASVSRFTLATRRAEDAIGTIVRREGGAAPIIEDGGGPAGTSITVDQLFFNVPARRKFLRTVGTELAHAEDAVLRQVLIRPSIDVRVTHEGREILRASKARDLATRVASLLGERGRGLLPVSFSRDGIAVEGLAGGPAVTAADGSGSWLYVNERHVRDAVVRRGVAQAYEGVLPRGRHPVVVLLVRVAPDTLDVNVHPAKTEVRFRDPGLVAGVITEAIRRALGARPAPLAILRAPDAPPVLPFAVDRPSIPAHPDDDPRAPMLLAEPTVPVPVTPAPEFLVDTVTWRDLRVVGEHDGWLVCGGGAGFWFVDRAVASMRLARLGLPERLVERAVAEPRVVSHADSDRLVTLAEEADCGLRLGALGGGRVAILAVPELVPTEGEAAFAATVLRELDGAADVDEARDAVRDAIAAAIPIDRSPEALTELLAMLDARQVPLTAPIACAVGADEVRRRLR